MYPLIPDSFVKSEGVFSVKTSMKPVARYDVSSGNDRNPVCTDGLRTNEFFISNLGDQNITVEIQESDDTKEISDNTPPNFYFEKSFAQIGAHTAVIKPQTIHQFSVDSAKKFMQIAASSPFGGSIRVQAFFLTEVMEIGFVEEN